MRKLLIPLIVVLFAATLHAEPKKLLVVTTTTGFRHSSIPTLEKVLAQLGKDSGEFTVDFICQPPGVHAGNGFPVKLKDAATPEEKKMFEGAERNWNETLKTALLKLSSENLTNYDGVIFASTTGDLPIPDPQGLLDWIKAGHAFIGIHAASDTFHHWPGYVDMLGGEFNHHGPQVGVECLNEDPQHPANAQLGKTWMISQEEIYQFKNYDATKVHDLLILDKKPDGDHSPGHFPVSWCKNFGAGMVFYTSLGHREDIIDADLNMKDRKNSPEISKAYQAHVLGGIEWALGLKSKTSVTGGK
jgi:type 1 glutamine amidotransferase